MLLLDAWLNKHRAVFIVFACVLLSTNEFENMLVRNKQTIDMLQLDWRRCILQPTDYKIILSVYASTKIIDWINGETDTQTKRMLSASYLCELSSITVEVFRSIVFTWKIITQNVKRMFAYASLFILLFCFSFIFLVVGCSSSHNIQPIHTPSNKFIFCDSLLFGNLKMDSD